MKSIVVASMNKHTLFEVKNEKYRGGLSGKMVVNRVFFRGCVFL